MAYKFKEDVTTVTKKEFTVEEGTYYLHFPESEDSDDIYYKITIGNNHAVDYIRVSSAYQKGAVSYLNDELELPYLVKKYFSGNLAGEEITEQEFNTALEKVISAIKPSKKENL